LVEKVKVLLTFSRTSDVKHHVGALRSLASVPLVYLLASSLTLMETDVAPLAKATPEPVSAPISSASSGPVRSGRFVSALVNQPSRRESVFIEQSLNSNATQLGHSKNYLQL